ncbi:hypothetical protein ABPG77_005956 [Micractinium sp. CCAP 211/92]
MAACLPLCQPLRPSASRTCRRRGPSTRAALTVGPSNERPVQQKERLLPLLSDYVQATASVSRFERFAGRSAMVGAGVALLLEATFPSTLPDGLFGSATTGGAAQFAALVTMLVCCSAALAARLQRPFSSRRLLEPIIASLTSKRRSFSGVTQTNVDRAVDAALDTIFTSPFILSNFVDYDEEL